VRDHHWLTTPAALDDAAAALYGFTLDHGWSLRSGSIRPICRRLAMVPGSRRSMRMLAICRSTGRSGRHAFGCRLVGR
jgi:hypothetical protein